MIDGGGIDALLAEAPFGVKLSELVRLTGREPDAILRWTDAVPPLLQGASGNASSELPSARASARVVTVEGTRDRYVLTASTWQKLRDHAVSALHAFHRDMPDEPGPDVARLRRIALPQIPDDLWRRLIADLTAERIVHRSGPWLHLPGHAVTLSEGEKTLASRLQPLIMAGRFNPPWVRDLANKINEPEDSVRQVLRKQVTQGAVFQVVHDLFYDRQSIDELATVITKIAHEHGAVEAAQYRDAVGLGRKRAIQILEFFDRAGHTRRMRDAHVLRADSEWSRA
jgi:selenocysteine-specific elongation factor